ncbi:MAG TPA: hypothetical protein EYP53_06440 [Candidatus Latescibacteria bacterium]|nr:hypothetical protein [Candidatus Latescibacterota bacterium]
MCGIVGYIGPREVMPILIEGLKRLEYRGYDSAGVAMIADNRLVVEKQVGKIAKLERMLKGRKIEGRLGIGHTRWATHGAPSPLNAHPHLDCTGRIAIIHNGIIENYRSLRLELEGMGHRFISETDTEIIAHLIEEFYKGDLEEAVRMALIEMEGTYGILMIAGSRKNPVRSGSFPPASSSPPCSMAIWIAALDVSTAA